MNRSATAAAPDLPTRRDEAWRYAPHADLARLTFGPSGGPTAVPADVAAQIPELDGPRVVIVNGAVDPALSDLTMTAEGLTITTLADELDGGSSSPSTGLPREDDPVDAFDAFNTRFGRDGAVIRVVSGHTITVPIHVVDLAVPGDDHNTASTGVVIELGDDCRATVVETRLGGPQEGGANVRTTITLGDRATLEHIVLQDAPATQISLNRVEVIQGAASTYRARSFNLGASYGRIAFHVQLAGEAAHADLSGLYFGFGDQTLDQQIDVVHAAKGCSSRQLFRGVLDDASTGIFSGGIDVRPGADGTDAEQENHNLLLSDRAEADTQPRLEILADDVACKHGATVGQLDETALYYLRSRGIPAGEARGLLINGFADQVVDDVAFETLRTWIIDRLRRADA
ncbi:MAG: Fe-S cluster assembly protein SufD [Acidimicrobiales bacterium]